MKAAIILKLKILPIFRSPVWSNCLFWAVTRWKRKGGYLLIRKSRHGWWPHFLWSSSLDQFWSYSARFPRDDLRAPPPIFRGMIDGPGDAREAPKGLVIKPLPVELVELRKPPPMPVKPSPVRLLYWRKGG